MCGVGHWSLYNHDERQVEKGERTLSLSAAVVLRRCTGVKGVQHQHCQMHTFLAGAELEWAMDEVIEEDAAAQIGTSWEWAGR